MSSKGGGGKSSTPSPGEQVDKAVAQVLKEHAFLVPDPTLGTNDTLHSHENRVAVALHHAISFLPGKERAPFRLVSRLWHEQVPLAPFLPSETPRTLRSDFSVLRVIGMGTFATVYLARHTASKFVYAVKCLPKHEQVRLQRVQQLRREVLIHRSLDHPNIARLVSVFQDPSQLHLVQECVIGGELFTHLNHRTSHRASEVVARFYAAQLVIALEYLHGKHDVVYRDLRQENILVARNGYVKITDFGNARFLRYGERAKTLCGAPDSAAPEMFLPDEDNHTSHGKAVDWWALGVLIFELLVGFSPFYSENPMDIYARTACIDAATLFPESMEGERTSVSNNARNFVLALLQRDERVRLGTYSVANSSDANLQSRRWIHDAPEDVRGHPWFEGIDWAHVLAQSITPPLKAFVPIAKSDDDCRNFDLYHQAHAVQPRVLRKPRAKMTWNRWCGDL